MSFSTRQACDRCRGLKLRCTRANDPETCDRCLRKGSQCAYSARLPKGRRRVRVNDGNSGPREGSPRSQSSTLDSDSFPMDDLVEERCSARSFDWLRSIDPALCDQVLSSFDPLPGSQDQHPYKQMKDRGNGSGLVGSGGSFDGEVDGQGHVNKDDPEALIAQLAQLSTLVSLLRRSGDDLSRDCAWPSLSSHVDPETDGPYHKRQLPSIGDSVFESVAAWLSRGPTDTTSSCCSSHTCRAQAPNIKTLGDLLYHVFSASYRLVELVRPVPMATASSNAAIAISGLESTGPFLDFVNPSLNGEASTFLGAEPAQMSAYDAQASNSGVGVSNVIRHLLIANHTMLLEMYANILGLLQRYMDQTVSEGTALPLLTIRLASVVHTCSYLISRQHQALESYPLSPFGCLVEPETVADTMTTQSIKTIDSQVQQRIMCLQQMAQV